MSQSEHLFKFIVLAVVFCLTLTGLSFAQTEEVDVKDLNTYTCKEIMRLDGKDREIAIGVLHGFFLGKKGTTQYNVEELSVATDKFFDYCLDNPKEKALKSMENSLKK